MMPFADEYQAGKGVAVVEPNFVPYWALKAPACWSNVDSQDLSIPPPFVCGIECLEESALTYNSRLGFLFWDFPIDFNWGWKFVLIWTILKDNWSKKYTLSDFLFPSEGTETPSNLSVFWDGLFWCLLPDRSDSIERSEENVAPSDPLFSSTGDGGVALDGLLFELLMFELAQLPSSLILLVDNLPCDIALDFFGELLSTRYLRTRLRRKVSSPTTSMCHAFKWPKSWQIV